jgi:hypothetical protein
MPYAAFRKSPQHEDLANLAKEHLNHDLNQEDRDVLVKAGGRIYGPATIGTLVGLGLGLYAAFRLRKVRLAMFNAFRASEKPTSIVFAGGRTGKFRPFLSFIPLLSRFETGDYFVVVFFVHCVFEGRRLMISRTCPRYHAVSPAESLRRFCDLFLFRSWGYHFRWRAWVFARELVCFEVDLQGCREEETY